MGHCFVVSKEQLLEIYILRRIWEDDVKCNPACKNSYLEYKLHIWDLQLTTCISWLSWLIILHKVLNCKKYSTFCNCKCRFHVFESTTTKKRKLDMCDSFHLKNCLKHIFLSIFPEERQAQQTEICVWLKKSTHIEFS